MKTIIKSYRGWAINTRSEEGHGLIGRFWRFEDRAPGIPIHLRGHKIALFETRKQARENLDGVRKAFPNARIVRVLIDICV